jgi:hypothetical protein
MPVRDKNANFELPNPEGGKREDLAPFLKSHDLPNGDRVKAKITSNARKSVSRFGAGVIVDVKIGNKKHALFVKFASGNYSRLFERFGKDASKWRGTLELERGNHLGKDYVKVV